VDRLLIHCGAMFLVFLPHRVIDLLLGWQISLVHIFLCGSQLLCV
jgi:hypothetical protein